MLKHDTVHGGDGFKDAAAVCLSITRNRARADEQAALLHGVAHRVHRPAGLRCLNGHDVEGQSTLDAVALGEIRRMPRVPERQFVQDAAPSIEDALLERRVTGGEGPVEGGADGGDGAPTRSQAQLTAEEAPRLQDTGGMLWSGRVEGSRSR